jgi:hypothetical protein
MLRLGIMDDRWHRGIDCRAMGRCALLLVAAVIAFSCAARNAQAEPTEQRIRIAWGGKQPRMWTGKISLDAGEFRDVAVLGTEPDAPGSIWQEQGSIRIGSISPHLFDGIDVTVIAEPTSQLSVELQPQEGGSPTVVTIPVSEAAQDPASRSLDDQGKLDDQGNRILILRTPGDQVRIKTDRKDLIFRPGESFSFGVALALDEVEEGTSVDLSAALVDDVSGKVEWSKDERLAVPVSDSPTSEISIPLPKAEGVYTLRLRAKRPSGFNARFGPLTTTKSMAARDVQIVVFDPSNRAAGGATTWRQVLEIDPVNPGWWQRLPNWTQVHRLPGFPMGPLGSTEMVTSHHPLRTLTVLPSTPPPGEPHWRAFPLPVQGLRRPHIVEVEYPVGIEQHLGLSILEANSTGRVEPISRDSGVYVEGSATEPPAELATHRFLFWPRSNSPLLLTVNRHPTAPGLFGRIRVYACGDRIGAINPVPLPNSARRTVAAYFTRPLFPEAFGAPDRVDAASGQSVDGWNTFYDGATRLSEYLSYAGYNAAVVSVLADGSSIYPSRLLMPTPRHDTSSTVDGGSDVPKKDVVELLLMSLERRNQSLIPALQLAAPLPRLETKRRATDPRVAGLELIDRNGRTWLDVYSPDRGLAPYYNLLHPQVQAEIVSLVDELLDRYGNHPAMAGLAIQLDGRGFSQLPGLEWGFDDATIAAFERATGIMVPGNGSVRFAQRADYLLGQQREAWQQWRADSLSQFFDTLARRIQVVNPDYQLILTTEMLFTGPGMKSRLRPQVLGRTKLNEQMLSLGIDAERLAKSPGIALCLSQHEGPSAPLVDRAIDLEINGAARAEQTRIVESTPRTALFEHRPQRLRLHTFDEMSPFGAQNTFTSLVAEPSPSGAAARRRFIEAIATRDPWIILDGGELLPMGQEDEEREVLTILGQLPRGGSNETVTNQQPIVVRTFEFEGQLYCIVINECPWQADATVTLKAPERTTVDVLGEADPFDAAGQRSVIQGTHPLAIRLGPYGIWAGRLSSTDVSVKGIQVAVEPRADEELRARVRDLVDRDLTEPSFYKALTNPGFEPIPLAPGVGGWELLGSPNPSAASIDTSRPLAGKGCLQIKEVTVQSPPFKTPPTGQLGLSLNVRAEGTTGQTQLRIIFEANADGEQYRRHTILGGNGADAQPLTERWGYYAFGVEDLPLDSQGLMRVRFELTGPGTVWIDDVLLYDLLFPIPNYRRSDPERLALVKVQHAAQSAYDSGRMSDCLRILDGYWSQFVSEYTPLSKPSIARPAAPEQPPVAETPATEDVKAPTVGERVKEWIPGFLRF